ncbi:TY-Chap domain-containing protein [Nocardia sp. NPDC055321]
MTDDGWTRLLEDIPLFLYPEYDEQLERVWPKTGECIELRDVASNDRILFFANGDIVEIWVMVPDDPQAAQRLLSVLQRQQKTARTPVPHPDSGELIPREEALWHPVPRSEKFRWTSWRHPADDYKPQVAAAVVEVLRDGLGSDSSRIRYRAWNYQGPARGLLGISYLSTVEPDRPTQRGVPPRCSEWADFIDRLDWAVTTLPLGEMLVLSAPAKGRESCHVQFYQIPGSPSRAHECIIWDEAGLAIGDLNVRMTGLGWIWDPEHLGGEDDPVWRRPWVHATAYPTVRAAAELTAATFRDIAGVVSPSELVFESMSEPVVTYLAAELGLNRKP